MPASSEHRMATGSDRWLAATQTHPGVVYETTREAESAAHRAVPPEIVLDIERHITPEGAGPGRNERLMPYLMAVLALMGITIVGSVLGVREGWRAALLGIGAVTTGCSVAWIVVWGAGLMRAREERDISDEVETYVVPHPPGTPHPMS